MSVIMTRDCFTAFAMHLHLQAPDTKSKHVQVISAKLSKLFSLVFWTKNRVDLKNQRAHSRYRDVTQVHKNDCLSNFDLGQSVCII